MADNARRRRWRATAPSCSVNQCERPQEHRGLRLCNSHFLRWTRYGRLERAPHSPKKNKDLWFNPDGTRKPCLVALCGKPSRAAGYCSGHYHRLSRYGDPTFSPIVKRVCVMGKCTNLTTAEHRFCVAHAKSLYNARLKGTVPRIAREAVGNALKYGKLIRQPCETCGAAKVHAHHADYERPLDVQWLCPKHHMQLHARLRQ